MRAQASTEYLATLGALLFIGLIAGAVLFWPVGSTKDVKQSQTDIKYRISAMQYPELSQGLFAYYKFDEGIGTTAYNSVTADGLSATLGNGTDASIPAWNSSGKSGKALTFDGANSYMEISDNPALRMNGSGTITAWINPRGYGGSNYGRIVDKSTSTGAANGYHFFFTTSNYLVFNVNAGSQTASSTNSVTLNQWNFVAVTFSSAGRTIYVNGVDVTSSGGSVTTLPPNIAGVVAIGNRAGATDRTFNGTIDDVHFYNRVLSPTEIELLYKNPGYP